MHNPEQAHIPSNIENNLAQHELRQLQAGVPEIITPSESLMEPAQFRAEHPGLRPDVSLKAAIELGGKKGTTILVLDRGEVAHPEPLINSDASKTNAILTAQDRFILIDEAGLANIDHAAQQNLDYRERMGWIAARPGESIALGREEETGARKLRMLLSDRVSRKHAVVSFGEDGSVVVTDRGSSNGTRVLRPNTNLERESIKKAAPERAAKLSRFITRR